MILRLSEKVAKRLGIGARPSMPLATDPLSDWSVHEFVVHRRRLMIAVNTPSLLALIVPGRGMRNVRQIQRGIVMFGCDYTRARGLPSIEKLFASEITVAKAFNR